MMFKRFLLLFLIAQPAFSFHMAAQSTEAEKYYLEGLKWADSSQAYYTLAIINFHKAIMADSTNAKYYHEFGKVMWEEAGPYYAIPEYDKAIALDPKFADAYLSRGHAYFAMRRTSKAIEDYETAYKYTTVDSNRAYYLKAYINPSKKRQETNKEEIIRLQDFSKYIAYCYAALLKGKWIDVSIKEYEWAAQQSRFSRQKKKWKSGDNSQLAKMPSGRLEIETAFLEAVLVEYYLDKVLPGKSLRVQLDYIAKYINLKTKDKFYSAALIYQHFLNEANGYTSVALLKDCSADQQRVIKDMLPDVKRLDEDPDIYYGRVKKAPVTTPAPKNQSTINTYVKYDPKKVAEASPDIKKQSVGYMYTGPYEYDQDLYLIFDYNQYKDQFYVLHYAAELSKSDKLNQRQATRFVWMHIPDLRVGYKNKTLIRGKNYQICSRCNGSHVERYTTGGGATYNKISTDHLDSRNDKYVKSGGRSAVKANYRECRQCQGRGYTEQ